MNSLPKFSIIIPSWNHCDDLLRPCCESIIKFTDLTQVEVIVVLNGCTDNSREYVESLGKPFKVVWIEEQSGYTKSVNAGIRESVGAYLIPFNNDCILLDQPVNQWIEMLYEPFSDSTVGLTGPIKTYCPHAQRDFLIFFCVMIRRDTLDQLGGSLDESFAPGGGEDTSLCCEAEDAGWKVVRVPPDSPMQWVDKGDPSLPAFQQHMWVTTFPLYHLAGASFGSPEMFDGYQEILAHNAEILRKRYAVSIQRAQQIEGWMADSELHWLAQRARKASSFLECGSWHGRSTRAIADNLPESGVCMAVDSWNGSSGEPDAHATAHLREGDDAYLAFWDNNYEHIESGKIVPIRMQSANAAMMLRHRNVQVDIAWIDADHSYEGCKADILNFRELVKPGGLLCGHDYYLPNQNPLAWVGVRQCVDELFPSVKQAPNTTIWYVRCTCLSSEKCDVHGRGNEQHVMLRQLLELPVSESFGEYGGFFSCIEKPINSLPA